MCDNLCCIVAQLSFIGIALKINNTRNVKRTLRFSYKILKEKNKSNFFGKAS
jgi:hypothetical protein